MQRVKYFILSLLLISLHAISIQKPRPANSITVKFAQRFGNIAANKVYDSSVQHLFRDGAGLGAPTILNAGDTVTGVGLKRQLPFVGLIETIIDGNIDGNGQSFFTYTVENPTIFTYPVSWHRGYFEFDELGDGSTMLNWQVDFVPLRFCGPFAKGFTEIILTIYLKALSAHLNVECTAEKISE